MAHNVHEKSSCASLNQYKAPPKCTLVRNYIVNLDVNLNLYVRCELPKYYNMRLFTLVSARDRLRFSPSRAEPELSHMCGHPTAQIEAQLRGSSRIRAEPCSHCWLSSGSAQSETSVKRLYVSGPLCTKLVEVLHVHILKKIDSNTGPWCTKQVDGAQHSSVPLQWCTT